jgi:hypothetical protein
LIDRHWAEVAVSRYTAKLGDVEVWIANPFYSYGYQCGTQFEARPSLKTMHRLDSLVLYVKTTMVEEGRKAHQKTLEGL